MNPDTTLRTWALACGRQFGIRHASDYRWSDAMNRQKESYITYQLVDCAPDQDGQQSLNSKTNYTVHRKAAMKHVLTCWIDLYNSQDGMYELSAFGVAAHHSPDIRQIFKDHGSMFIGVDSVSNLSTFDDEEILYHHRMVCTFTENVEISLDEINGAVDVVAFNLEDGDNTQTVEVESLTGTADDLVGAGEATFDDEEVFYH